MYARDYNVQGCGASGVNERRITLRSCRANTHLTYPPCEFAPGAFQLRTHHRLPCVAVNLFINLTRTRVCFYVLSSMMMVMMMRRIMLFFEVSFLFLVVKQLCFLAAPDRLMKDAIVE